MSKKTLKFNNIRVNKKEFHKSQQLIDLDLLIVNQLVVSDKFRHSVKGFKYVEGKIVKPLCTVLPQMSKYIKYSEKGGKNMSFMIKDVSILDKYNKIWDKIKKTFNMKFHSMPVYDQTYIKAKVRQFDGKIKKKFLGDEIPKENMHYTSVVCTTINSVMRIDKKVIVKFIQQNANTE